MRRSKREFLDVSGQVYWLVWCYTNVLIFWKFLQLHTCDLQMPPSACYFSVEILPQVEKSFNVQLNNIKIHSTHIFNLPFYHYFLGYLKSYFADPNSQKYMEICIKLIQLNLNQIIVHGICSQGRIDTVVVLCWLWEFLPQDGKEYDDVK